MLKLIYMATRLLDKPALSSPQLSFPTQSHSMDATRTEDALCTLSEQAAEMEHHLSRYFIEKQDEESVPNLRL